MYDCTDVQQGADAVQSFAEENTAQRHLKYTQSTYLHVYTPVATKL